MAQSLIVAIVVGASAAYAVWALLMPRAWRRSLARRLGWAEPVAACGGCDGCGSAAPPAAAPRESVITLHRQRVSEIGERDRTTPG